MRLKAALALVGAAVAAFLLWRLGAFSAVAVEAAAAQRAMQGALSQAVLALRAGEPGALAWLMAASAAYGIAHAVGPGHGKALVAAAAAGTDAPARRLALIAAAGSLAQGLVAVAVVYGALALAWRLGLRDLAGSDAMLAPVGHATLAALGLWIGWRGLRGLLAPAPVICGCGHAHGHHDRHDHRDRPMALALVAAIAVRPCGGALITLAVAWSAGVPAAGALAVLAMSAGTACVTVAAALAAAAARQAALAASGPGFARMAAGLQAGVGALALFVGAAGLAATL